MADRGANDLDLDTETAYVRPRDMTLRTADGKCLNCCDIDFEEFFSLASSPLRPIASVPVELARIASEYCQFCKLLIDAGSQVAGRAISSTRGQQMVTFYFERVHHHGTWDDKTFKRPGTVVMKITIRPAPWPIKTPEAYLTIYPIFEKSLDDRLHSGRLVNPANIDLDFVGQWLEFCDALHGSDCNQRSYLVTPRDLSVFRVIDVRDMCLKTESLDCRYVALSYVWGNAASLMSLPSNIDELYRKGSLRALENSIAPTIRDAIHVVREIGERYLWVDCLCIVQGSEKSIQIAAMDQIFGSACLTIVAACGVDASTGLSGIRQGSRNIKQLSWKATERLTLAIALPAPNEMLNAQWSSRAWTLQEELLGRRFLIFRDSQAIWQCRHGMQFEDTLAENKAVPFQGLRQLPRDKMINLPTTMTYLPTSALIRPPEFVRYATIVQSYTSRHLTEACDVLNAFEGVSKSFQVLFGARLLSGLPESFLDVAVLWQPKVMLKRRDNTSNPFPSWSWAGWIGEITYPKVDTEERGGQEGVVPLLRWFVTDSAAGNELNPGLRPLNRTGIGIDESALNSYQTLSTCMWFPMFEEPRGSDVPREIDNNHVLHSQQCLAFWTSAAYMSITGKEGNAEIRDQTHESKHSPQEFQIRNKFGYVIGHLTMTGSSPTQTVKDRHEFIVVSGSQHIGFNMINWKDKFSPQPGTWDMYNVLLVEWDNSRHIAYRVGLGRVLKTAWATGHPKNKYVVLG